MSEGLLMGPTLPNFLGGKAERVDFFTALAALQAELPTIAKDRTARVEMKTGGTYTYDYADLTDVTEQLMPKLAAHGFSWTCLPMWADASRVVLRYMLAHTGGGVLHGDYPLNLGGSPQAAGGAVTYARRYCLCSVTGVAPKGDDDDAAAAQASTAQRRPSASRPKAERPGPRAGTPDGGPTAQRATQPAPPGGWSAGQRSKIMATYGDVGIDDREERLQITAAIIGRPLSSSNELTYDEAGKVITTLDAARHHEGGFTGWLGQLDLTAGNPPAEPQPPAQPYPDYPPGEGHPDEPPPGEETT